MALSQRTCQARLPHTPFSCGNFSSTGTSGAPGYHESRVRWCLTSQPPVHFAMVPASACLAFHSALPTEKVHYRPNVTLLNPNKAEDTTYSSRETTTELPPPRKRSDTRTPSDDQWHESQWQRDRSRTDLQRSNMVRTWSQLGAILVNSSFEHKNYHHQMPALIAPCSDIDCGQSQGIMLEPPANGTRLLVTTI